jgi:hypothetical protein
MALWLEPERPDDFNHFVLPVDSTTVRGGDGENAFTTAAAFNSSANVSVL